MSLFCYKSAWIAKESILTLLTVVTFSVVDALETLSSERVTVARFQLVDISVTLAVLANSVRAVHSKWIAKEIFLTTLATGSLRSRRTSVTDNSESVSDSLWHCRRCRTFAASRTGTSLTIVLSSIVRVSVKSWAADIAEIPTSVVLALALPAYCVTRLGGMIVTLTRLAFLVRIVRVGLESKIGTACISSGSALWFVTYFDPVCFVRWCDRSISFLCSFKLDLVKKTLSRETQLYRSQVIEHGDECHRIKSRFEDTFVKAHVIFVSIGFLKCARKLRLLA